MATGEGAQADEISRLKTEFEAIPTGFDAKELFLPISAAVSVTTAGEMLYRP